MLIASSRTLLSRAASAPCACAKRFSHKLVEVELTRDVPALGPAGTRHIISPGRARNILIPSGEARYVVRGQAVSALGSMFTKLEQSRLRSPTKAQSLADKQAQLAQDSIDPLAVARKIESDVFASISFLPPIPFARRTIAAGATEGPIHGSVSAADVVAAVRDFGITLEESVVGGMGFAEGQPGVEKGRVKATGVYDFEVPFKTLGETVTLKVDVSPEQ